MLTWRYHLLSLMAIFLALGLGVLVGISISGNGVLDVGREVIVEDIQKGLDELREENNILSRHQANSQRFQEDTFPFLVGGRLQGKKIALVASSNTSDEIQRQLTSAVHGAGGQIVSTTILNAHFDSAAATAKVKAELKSDPQFAALDDSHFTAVAGRQLARDIGKTGGSKLLPVLQGSLVDSTSGRYDIPVDAVVLITRADDSQAPAYDDLEKNMLLSLKELGLLAVGSEPEDAPRSEIPLFLSVDVSSVDNLDSRIGQVSLVYVLAGEKGAFGVKPTADMLIPILRIPKLPASATTVPTNTTQTSTTSASTTPTTESP
ncbi:MAG: copper transporter [Thermoleophilia bacterium]